MTKVVKSAVLIFSIVAVGFIAIYYLTGKNNLKVAYVKNIDLYNNFSLKKELENKLTTVKTQRKSILDSLLLELKVSSSALQNADKRDEQQIKSFELRKQNYLAKQKEFDEDNERLTSQYNQEIWNQINELVSNYGKQKGYAFIYGATGNGGLMYAEEKYDVTDELKEFINETYKGEKK